MAVLAHTVDARTSVGIARAPRVLVIIDTLGVGGAEALLPTFLKRLDTSRFSASVLALDSRPRNHVRDRVVEYAETLTEWTRRPLLDMHRIHKITDFIIERDFDLVHTHLLYSNVQGALAAQRAGVPCVATLHNIYPSKSIVKSIPKRRIEAFALRKARASVIAVSQEVAQAYRGWGLLPSSAIQVIPNAIDLERLAAVSPEAALRTRAEVLAGRRGPLVLAVGRMVRQKGYPDLVRAARRIVDHFPEAVIAIAGKPSEDTSAITREITRVRLEEHVRLLGVRPDVPQLLAAADVYVMPSLWEGAPVALLEAMAAGRPVIATRVGGIPSVVEHGRNGLLVEPQDPVDFADAVCAVLDDSVLSDAFGQAARETAQQYGAEAWAQRIEHEYERRLQRGREDRWT